jgi:hypothetical protein
LLLFRLLGRLPGPSGARSPLTLNLTHVLVEDLDLLFLFVDGLNLRFCVIESCVKRVCLFFYYLALFIFHWQVQIFMVECPVLVSVFGHPPIILRLAGIFQIIAGISPSQCFLNCFKLICSFGSDWILDSFLHVKLNNLALIGSARVLHT